MSESQESFVCGNLKTISSVLGKTGYSLAIEKKLYFTIYYKFNGSKFCDWKVEISTIAKLCLTDLENTLCKSRLDTRNNKGPSVDHCETKEYSLRSTFCF